MRAHVHPWSNYRRDNKRESHFEFFRQEKYFQEPMEAPLSAHSTIATPLEALKTPDPSAEHGRLTPQIEIQAEVEEGEVTEKKEEPGEERKEISPEREQ